MTMIRTYLAIYNAVVWASNSIFEECLL